MFFQLYSPLYSIEIHKNLLKNNTTALKSNDRFGLKYRMTFVKTFNRFNFKHISCEFVQ